MSALPVSAALPLKGQDFAEPALERASDPSMEEILASIRRIIADEQESHDAAAPALAAVPQTLSVPKSLAEPARPIATARPMLAQAGESDFESWLHRTATGAVDEAMQAAPIAAPEVLREVARAEVADAGVGYAAAPEMAPPSAAPEALHTGFRASVQPQAAAPVFAEEAAPVAEPVLAPEIPDVSSPDVSSPDVSKPAEAVTTAPQVLETPLTRPEPVVEATPAATPQAAPAHVDTPLLSVPAGASVQSSFQALAQTMFMQNSDLVNDAVQAMLRPMLKQWLDDNLPVIVERLVRAEIERVARGGGR